MLVPVSTPFWTRVKALIKSHKISQKDFSAYIGININTLRFWICYGFYPPANLAYTIATSLGVSVEYLLTGEDGKSMKQREKDALKRKNAAAEIKKMVKKIELNAGLIG